MHFTFSRWMRAIPIIFYRSEEVASPAYMRLPALEMRERVLVGDAVG